MFYSNTLFNIHKILIFLLFVTALIFNSSCTRTAENDSTPSPPPAAQKENSSETLKDDISEGKSLELLYQKGRDAQAMGDFQQAKEIYSQVIEKDSGHYRARGRLGEIYFAIGEYEPAIREFRRVLDENPPNPGAAKSNLVLCYLAVDRPENALEYISSEIDAYSRWNTHLSFLAQAYYAQYLLAHTSIEEEEMYKKIIGTLQEGIESSPNPIAANMLRASLAIFKNEPNQVKVYLKDALNSNPPSADHISILFLLGALEAREKRNEEAKEYFHQVMEVIDRNKMLHFQNFMDGFYSLWAIYVLEGEPVSAQRLKSVSKKIPGGLREPEMLAFIDSFIQYIEAKEKGDMQKAVVHLKRMEQSIKDESIEGDYFYDALYKPFNKFILYEEMAKSALNAGDKAFSEEYGQKAKEILSKNFFD